MAVEVLLASLIIIIPLSVHAGVFSLFDNATTTSETVPEVIKTDLVLDTPVLTPALNSEPTSARGGSDLLVEDGALVSTGPIGKDEVDAARQGSGEISVYTVREGDTLSMIAEMFDVTTNTILWANDLSSAKAISPGDTLIILPMAGVRHVVKSGDTIAAIAKKYEADADEIVSYNQLEKGADLVVGTTLMIPGGALHTAAPVKKAGSATKSTGGTGKSSSLAHPIPGAIKTQGIHGYNAIDFGASVGTTIRAAAAGEVIVAKTSGWNGGYGNYVVIRHSNGVQTLYAHLSTVSVGVGASVGQGETIGAVGMTGKSTGPHLHFEVRGGKNPF